MKKILVDTNVLLRYLVDGDGLLEQTATKGVVWLLDEIVIELVFALEEHYKQPRTKIFDWVVEILMKPNCESNRILLFSALAVYKDRKNLSIVDAYLAAFSKINKVEVVTYDRKLKRRMVK